MKDVNTNIGGLFGILLAVLFIGLKLTGQISWSWWLVLAPIYGPLVVAVVVLVVIGLIKIFRD